MTKLSNFFIILLRDLIRITQLLGRRLRYPDRRTVVFCYDVGLCIISMQLAYWVYYGENQIYFSEFFILKQMAIYGCLCAGSFTLLQTYRPLWKYLNFIVVLILIIAVAIASGCYFLLMYKFNIENIRINSMLSVIAGSASLIAMVLSRLIYKFSLRWTLTVEDNEFSSISDTRILVYCHDKSICGYLSAISKLEHTNLDIVGVVVNDNDSVGKSIAGYPIVCTLSDIENYIVELNAEGQHPHKLIAALNHLPSNQVRHLFDIAQRHNMYLQKIPAPQDYTHSGILPTKLSLEDLFTDPLYIQGDSSLGVFYQDQVVMIIGAGGVIGLNLIDQLSTLSVKNLIVCESDQRLLSELKDNQIQQTIHYILTKGYTATHYDRLINHFKPSLLINLDSITEQVIAQDNPLETLYENLLVPVMLAQLAQKYAVQYFINTKPSFLSYDHTIITPINNILEAWCQVHDEQHQQSRFITIHLPALIFQQDEWVKSLRTHARQGRTSTIYLKSSLNNVVTPNSAAFMLLRNIFLFSKSSLDKISFQQSNGITLTNEQIISIMVNLFHLDRHKISLNTSEKMMQNTYFKLQKKDIKIEDEMMTVCKFNPKILNFDINLLISQLEHLYHQFDRQAVLDLFARLSQKGFSLETANQPQVARIDTDAGKVDDR